MLCFAVIIIMKFDEQERHPALPKREPDMMDTPPIQIFYKAAL